MEADGHTITTLNLNDYRDKYFIIFFLPMDFFADSSEVRAFDSLYDEFQKERCELIAVTSDNPLIVRRWIMKPVEKGGFGGPVKFPIVADHDLKLCKAVGAAHKSGLPTRTTFIVDWRNYVRYSSTLPNRMGKSVTEILRLVQAFRHSDRNGVALPAGWVKGDEPVPTEFHKKINTGHHVHSTCIFYFSCACNRIVQLWTRI